jgi:hypothetical protein
MIQLDGAERALLAKVLETEPDLGRKGNPRLRPLSMYSSELKNLKQVAAAVDLASKGQALAPNPGTAQRYGNTLSNLGLWEGVDRGVDIGTAGEKLLELAAADDGSPVYWQQHSREGDRIFFQHQVNRLLGDKVGLVNELWRETFFNVQDLLDHLSEERVRGALAEADLKEIEALQYMDSVGTEPWRYSRLDQADREAVRDLILRLRSGYDGAQAVQGDPSLETAKAYARAMHAYQRDVRFRVAGFVEAFLDLRGQLGEDFPRLSPRLQLRIRPRIAGQGGAAGVGGAEGGAAPARPNLPLPLQVIISGGPGSGKSELADRSAAGAIIIRTQFHSETTTASFVGGYRPVPVYENAAGVAEASGAPFPQGRPLIDYRFVPGAALKAVAAAVENPAQNVVLLIEELNRGNAAAIFGELFQLLDRGEGGASRYGVSVGAEAAVWLQAHGALDAEGQLRFPPNLHLWATMNSGDQGVFPIDTALRRRWSYRYLGYSQPCLYLEEDRVVRFAGRNVEWDRLRAALNHRLKALQVVEDRLIGPYFLTPAQLRNPGEILTKLLLYLWDDVLRFRQQEMFAADSFAGVAHTWQGGEGNPLIEGIVNLDEVEVAGDQDVHAGDAGEPDEHAGGPGNAEPAADGPPAPGQGV